ncbi:MAG: winged helix-turn-helix transcriptional regulator [Candidatus Heimdallarchaeota archaeon]|nr:winged helix-turn-helix transcriptional regulator [Candidatus Heimdallarchaeota archaeon]
MSLEKPLVHKRGAEYNLPVFDASVKTTAVHEEVMHTLLIFFLVSGQPKLDRVVDDLIRVLDLSPNTIGRALKSLKEFGLISYYRVGRYRTVELHLGNDFLKSLLARFFGLWEFPCKGKLHHKFVGFYPIVGHTTIREKFRSEIKRITSLVEDQQGVIDWLEKVSSLERYAETTLSPDEDDDQNPILQFIDQVSAAVKVQRTTQSHRLTPKELQAIVAEILPNFTEYPPWKYDLDTKRFNSVRIYKGEL